MFGTKRDVQNVVGSIATCGEPKLDFEALVEPLATLDFRRYLFPSTSIPTWPRETTEVQQGNEGCPETMTNDQRRKCCRSEVKR
jgi:hypothetical protein